MTRRIKRRRKQRTLVGLSTAQATELRRVHGLNLLPDVRVSVALVFVRKLVSPIPLLMLVTLIVAAVLADYVTTGCVAVLLLINAVLGTVQELRAHSAMRSLRAGLTLTTRVLRDGVPQQLASTELVPGDAVRVRLGDSVPADVAVTSGASDLKFDDSMITGESAPHAAENGTELMCGSVIVRGEALCTVLRTGVHSKTAARLELIKRASPKDHAMRALLVFIGTLIAFVSLLVIALIVSAVVRAVPLEPMVPLFVLLFVIGFPIALPTMLLVASSVGSNAAGKRGILVKRLGALIDAASMDVLCCDKTGTLTENRLAISSAIAAATVSPRHFERPPPRLLHSSLADDTELGVLVAARLCCNVDNLDPIDTAIVDRLGAHWMAAADGGAQFAVHSFEPFSSATHRTGAVVKSRTDGTTFRVSKGSVASILVLCGCDAEAASAVNAFADALTAESGCRVLGVAYAAAEDGPFRLVGLLTLDDVVRADSAASLAALRENGVSVVMITGDRASVALSVMQAVAISGSVVTPPTAFADEQERQQFWTDAVVAGLDCAAGVKPEDKYAIVVALQRRDRVVGMTGDGANDAAALKQAEVGVAVDSAVDLAKLSASAILLRGGIAPIAPLVTIGRAIHQRLHTFMLLKASKMFQTVLFVVIVFAAEGVVAIDASHVATMMFLMDLTVATIASDRQPPHTRPARRSLRFVVLVSIALGAVSCAEMVAFFYFALDVLDYRNQLPAAQRALMFLVNFLFGIASLFSVRERGWFFSSAPSRPLLVVPLIEALLVIIAVGVGIPGALAPVPPEHIAVGVAFCVLFGLLLNDAVKVAVIRWIGTANVDY